jgi:hypothetical protein
MTDARRKEIDAALKAGKTPDEIASAYQSYRESTFPFEHYAVRAEKVERLRAWIDSRRGVLTRGGEFVRCRVHGPVRLVDLRLEEKIKDTRVVAFSIPARGRGVVGRVVEADEFVDTYGYFHRVGADPTPCFDLDLGSVDAALGDWLMTDD